MVFPGILGGRVRQKSLSGKDGDRCSAQEFGEQGHSMLELLVCMGIMLILLAAALPRGTNMDKMYVKHETMRLMNIIRYVQTWSHQWDYCTNGLIGNNQGGVRPSLHFYNHGNWYLVDAALMYKFYHEGENGVTIKSNKKDYKFNARGHSTAGTIRISKNGYEERIVIDTVGRARVEEG